MSIIAKIKELKKHLPSIILLLVIIFFVGFFISTNYKINKRRNDLQDRFSFLKQEVQALEEKNRELREAKLETESDDYIEKVAREKLELKKPGEEVVVIQAEPTDNLPENQGNDKTWWDKFMNIFKR